MIRQDSRFERYAYRFPIEVDPSVTTFEDGTFFTKKDDGKWIPAVDGSKFAVPVMGSNKTGRAQLTGVTNRVASAFLGTSALWTDQWDKTATFHAMTPYTVKNGLVTTITQATDVVLGHVLTAPENGFIQIYIKG